MMKAKPMQKVKTFLEKTPNALLCVLGAVVFLAAFYFLRSRTPLDKIWLPTAMNNDEALYNRQVVSVITHGGPQGYFGYQEGTADIGRFSTWGPFLIWAYAIPGFLFGSSVNVVLWVNILFIALGIAVFAHSAKLSWWQCIVLCGTLFAVTQPISSCFSGASEGLHYALTLVLIGGAIGMERTGKSGYFLLTAAACVLETIVRPYTLLFWVFPLMAIWKDKKQRYACFALMAASVGVSLFAMAKLAAPYFSDGGMDFAGVQLLFQGHPVQAVAYELSRIWDYLKGAWKELVPTLQGNTTYIGNGCANLLATMAVTICCLIWDVRHGRRIRLKAASLGCSLIITLVLLGMYNIDPRHLMMMVMLQLAAVVKEDSKPAVVYLPLLLLALLPMNFSRGTMPEKNEVMAAQMEVVAEALGASRAEDNSIDPWDNTLAYSYGDDVFHGYLYAVPDGMGIEFDKNSYLWDAENPIYSRYVMCGHGTRVEERLLAENWQELVSTEDLVIYERVGD